LSIHVGTIGKPSFGADGRDDLGHVRDALAQRGKLDPDLRDAEKEVRPEATGVHLGTEITPCGSE
jgi:hypothetical protein